MDGRRFKVGHVFHYNLTDPRDVKLLFPTLSDEEAIKVTELHHLAPCGRARVSYVDRVNGIVHFESD